MAFYTAPPLSWPGLYGQAGLPKRQAWQEGVVATRRDAEHSVVHIQ